MSENVHKKRKRSVKDTGDEAPPRKSRVVGNEDESARAVREEDNVQPAALSAKPVKDGKSRQDKSERRSKKAKKAKDGVTGESHIAVESSKDDMATGKDFVSLKVPPTASLPTKRSKPSKTISSAQDSTVTTLPAKASRFIVFVGNLPYSATTAQILAHFSKLTPTSIRHNHDKVTGRSKGFAFLEFDGYDKMKTALKLYHHSMFDPDRDTKAGEDGEALDNKKPSAKGRKINVELTVGGGGKGKERIEKLKGKNQRLEEQRERTKVKEKEVKEKELYKKGGRGTDANATVVEQSKQVDGRGDIHPSRLGRVAR
jgi:nucleolar protein 6